MSTNELREALTASGASPLVPTIVDPMLLEYQRRYSPLVRSIPTRKWDSTVYYFNQRTARAAGGFVTDGGARPVSNSTYVQNSFTIRNMQAVGAVTGYAQAVTKGLIGDLKQQEVEGAIQGLYWDIETSILWGNSASTALGAYPQFDGLDTLTSTFSGNSQNAIDFNAAMSLGALDKLIDMVEQQSAMGVYDQQWMLVMSSTAAANYYYQVVPVIARQGEVLPSTEVSQATTGATSTVTLSFSTPAGLDGSQPNLYKVYRSTGTGTETLLGYVDACVGLAADGVTPILTTSIVDDGAKLTPKNGSTVPAQGPATYVGTNSSVKPQAAGQENIYLMARDQNFVVRPYVRELQPLDVFPTTSGPDQLPFAIASDTTLAVRAPKYLGRLARVTTSLSS